jgi:hypothetical protein
VEASMGVHFFHCTDGVDLVIDKTGRETSTSDELASHAQAVAAGLMRAVPGYNDWWNWSVHVYDAFGMVGIFDFPKDRRRAA